MTPDERRVLHLCIADVRRAIQAIRRGATRSPVGRLSLVVAQLDRLARNPDEPLKSCG